MAAQGQVKGGMAATRFEREGWTIRWADLRCKVDELGPRAQTALLGVLETAVRLWRRSPEMLLAWAQWGATLASHGDVEAFHAELERRNQEHAHRVEASIETQAAPRRQLCSCGRPPRRCDGSDVRCPRPAMAQPAAEEGHHAR